MSIFLVHHVLIALATSAVRTSPSCVYVISAVYFIVIFRLDSPSAESAERKMLGTHFTFRALNLGETCIFDIYEIILYFSQQDLKRPGNHT